MTEDWSDDLHTVEREQHQQRMRKEDFTAVSGRQAAGQRTVTMEETTKETLLEEDDWGVLCNLSQTALRFDLNDGAALPTRQDAQADGDWKRQ